ADAGFPPSPLHRCTPPTGKPGRVSSSCTDVRTHPVYAGVLCLSPGISSPGDSSGKHLELHVTEGDFGPVVLQGDVARRQTGEQLVVLPLALGEALVPVLAADVAVHHLDAVDPLLQVLAVGDN